MHSDFRNRYLDFDELSATLNGWAEAYPEITRLQSLGRTAEGRDLWLLVIGRDPDEIRPAVWVDGNMHAAELCGSSVALAIAEDILQLHVEGTAPRGMSAAVCEALAEIHFYVLPRISPDGAEQMLKECRYVRSNTRDERPNAGRSFWRSQDMDGDGRVLAMRVQDPTGEFVEAPEFENLMVLRTVDDEGPFYKLYPEGIIENYDGRNVPTPSFLSDSPTDLNRNFPWSWAPEHDQIGAGAYPGSEPESRAIVEFTSTRPNIFAWLNLHTFGGVGIRPLGHQPDSKMDQDDLAVFRQIGQWLEAATGYPMVSGYEEFLYEPDTPLHGDLTDYAYHQRGCVSYVVELWDLFAQVGLERKKPFVKSYMELSRDDTLAIARWDREHNQGRSIVAWEKYRHPQLGMVELGGVDRRVGMWNPPYELLPSVCDRHSAAFLRVAAMAPRIRIAEAAVEPLGGGLARVDILVENHGYLPSHVLNSAKKLDWNEPLYLEIECDGCALAEGSTRRTLGHLDGWGRGAGDGTGALHYPFGRGSTGSARVSLIVRGGGRLLLTVRSCRIGAVRRELELSR